MNWATIIALFFQYFGPAISELLKKLLDSLFKKVSKDLDLEGVSEGGELLSMQRLLQASIKESKRPLLRIILRVMDNHLDSISQNTFATSKFNKAASKEEKAEMKILSLSLAA